MAELQIHKLQATKEQLPMFESEKKGEDSKKDEVRDQS
jgi:hypothetical protein